MFGDFKEYIYNSNKWKGWFSCFFARGKFKILNAFGPQLSRHICSWNKSHCLIQVYQFTYVFADLHDAPRYSDLKTAGYMYSILLLWIHNALILRNIESVSSRIYTFNLVNKSFVIELIKFVCGIAEGFSPFVNDVH